MPRWTADLLVSGAVAFAALDAASALWDETARTLKVEPWDTNASGQTTTSGIGVALDAAAASASNTSIRVVVLGFAFANIGSGTSAVVGDNALGSTTKGLLVTTTPAATVVVGTSLGTFIGTEDGALDVAPVWIAKGG
jgi:hypothetical protein